MKETPLTFECKGKQIVGILHTPKNKNPPLIIMCHGWGSNRIGTWQGLFVRAAREFCKKGFAVFRFDFRGSGDSEGEFEEQTVDTMVEDLDCVLNNLCKVYSSIGLIGHSVGGKVAILKALKNKKIKCLVLWSAAASHKETTSTDTIEEIMDRKNFYLADSGFWINSKQMKNCLIHDGLKDIKSINIPVLVANGSEDTSILPSHAKKLYKNANNPKKLVFIKGANHFFLDDNSKKELFNATAEWFEKWLTTSSGK